MSLSPTQLTKRHLAAEDCDLIEVTERWNPHARVRNDLFGFVDVLALRDDKTIAVQTTSASNVSARLKKIREHENLPAVLAAGWQVRVHGWKKKKNRWVLQRDEKVT